jgi:cation:H+ antiporter
MPFSVIFFTIGLVSVITGGYLVVKEAVAVSMQVNTSLKLLSVCVIAVLTSVPELIVSYISARRGQSDLAMANILGSNIFNIAFIMGLSALIRPLAFNTAFDTDILVLLIGTSALYLFCRGERSVQRIEAVSLLAIYAAYFVFVIIRG